MNPPRRAPITLTIPARAIELKERRLAFAFADEDVLEELPPDEAVCVKPIGPDSVVEEVAAARADETLNGRTNRIKHF